ncbi:MAG: 6-hydroxymethylpterin diphosphokinase MptE-like protein [Chlamydiota bacterium]
MDLSGFGTTKTFEENSAFFLERRSSFIWDMPPFSSQFSFFLTKKGEVSAKKTGVKKNIFIHSKEDIAEEMNHWKSTLPLEKVEILYIYGIGLGYPFFALKDWVEKSSKHRLVFLEDSPEFFGLFLQTTLLQEVLSHPQVDFLYMPTKKQEENLSLLMAKNFPRTFIEIVSAPHYKKKKKRLEELRKEVFRKMTVVSSIYAEVYAYPFLFRNFLASMKRLSSASMMEASWKGAFSNVPAIICGAGPSLNASIPFLENIGNKALILAGGSAITALSSKGILPHLGVAVDPTEEEVDRFVKANAWEVPLCYLSRLQERVFMSGNHPLIFMKSFLEGAISLWLQNLELPGEWIGEKLHEESLSVTLITLAVADYLGCNPIIFCGVDLAYSDGKRYAEGVTETNVPLQREEVIADRLLVEKGQKEQKVVTAVRWVMESFAISDYVKKTKEKIFLNVSEEGLGFKNVPYTSWEDVSFKYFDKELDLHSFVHCLIEKTKTPDKEVKRIDEKIREWKSSFIRCKEFLHVLVDEKENPKRIVAKIELEEEEAFRNFLSMIYGGLAKFFSYLHGDERQHTEEEKWKILLHETNKFIEIFADFGY